jgi:arsenate reductase-like glutaredoxin family protein
MGRKIEPDQEQKIREGYFENLKLDQNAEQAGCSIGTAHSHTKALEEEIAKEGLMPVLEKYGLTDAKQVAVLKQSLRANDTSADECFHVIPLARKFAAGHIDVDKIGTVVDQVFNNCPPELAQPLAASIIEFAEERAKNGNLTITDLRAEHQKMTTSVDGLKSLKGTLTTEVQGLQNQQTDLQGRVNALRTDEQVLQRRLADAHQTDALLKHYQSDRVYLHDVVGVDISNVPKARQFFEEMQRLGYSPATVVAYLLNIPSLSKIAQILGQEVRNLLETKDDSIKEIADLDIKKAEAVRSTKEAQQRTIDAEEDANAKIIASKKHVDDRLAQEKVTLAEIEDTKRFRAELKEAGVEP